FKEATGDYCGLLGSDDVLYEHKTAVQVSFLQEHREVDWVYSCVSHIDSAGNRLRGLFGQDLSKEPYAIEKLIRANRIPDMTVLVKRECLNAIGAHTRDLIYSDWEFWIRMISRFKVGFI